MTECEAVQERMPEVFHGRAVWGSGELEHLERCETCAAELRLFEATRTLGRGSVDVEALARTVLDRLRTEPLQPAIRRIPWRAGMIGLVALAASVLVFVAAPHRGPQHVAAAGESLAVMPELGGLDDSDLVAVLQSISPSVHDVGHGLVPHLGDLTDSELEQLLQAEGGAE